MLWRSPIKAYTNELTVTKSSVPSSRWFLEGLEKFIFWALIKRKIMLIRCPVF